MTFKPTLLEDHSPYEAISTIDDGSRRGTRDAMRRVLIIEPGAEGDIHEFFAPKDPLTCPDDIDAKMATLLATMPKL